MQQTNQLNIEFIFRKIYELFFGAGSFDYSGLQSFLAHLWIWINIIGYALAVAALGVIVYCLVRLFDLRAREKEYYGSVLVAPEAGGDMNPRWQHIESLAGSANPSDWRQAIIEADIMLDDMLNRQGYIGTSVGDKLKSVEGSDFATLGDAWEAHKVRNLIAHQGSSFDLSETVMRRTLARYEGVFREFGAL
jgi:hypothetical protein